MGEGSRIRAPSLALLAAVLWLAPAVAGDTAPGPGGGAEARVLPPPGDPPWRELRFPNVERATLWEPVVVDGRRAVRARARCSASALLLPLEDVDLTRTPLLAWSWRADRLVGGVDPRTRAGDDFAARVYVTFPYDPSQDTLLGRLARRLVQALYREPLPGRALDFVWADAGEPVGASWPDPRSGKTRVIVQRAGGAGRWQRERVDVEAAARDLLGPGHAHPNALALLTDADDTCQEATALYADFRFLPRPSDPAAEPESER